MKAQFILGLLSWLFVHPAQALEDLIKNGAFEGTVSQNHWKTSGDIRANSEFKNGRNSRGYAYLSQANGAPGNNLSGTIYQEVEVPEDTLTATLIFWHYITTDGTDNSDKLVVSVRSKSGTELKRVTTLYAANKSITYQQHPGIELAEYAGKTIRIHFEATTDSKVPTTFRIDDVSLLVMRREDDLAPPEILRFYPRESVYEPGEQVVFEYRVRDQGGSGVRSVKLLRNEANVDESHPSWIPVTVQEFSDNGDLHNGTLADSPPIGNYWYTIVVEDNAGNRTTASQEGLGPDQVTVVVIDDFEYPSVTSFESDQGETTAGNGVKILFRAVDEGSGLAFVELYSNTASNDPSDGGWEMRERKTFSGELEASGEFSVTVKSGSEWFDLRIGDRAGNVRMATEQAISPIRIVGQPKEDRVEVRIKVVPERWGIVNVDPLPGPDGKYQKGTTIKLDAIPLQGYALRIWNGIVSGVRPTAYAVAASGEIEAVFESVDPARRPEITSGNYSKDNRIFTAILKTKESFCYLIQKSENLSNWVIVKHICGNGQSEQVELIDSQGRTQQMVGILEDASVDSGITLQMPLPSGRAWYLTTEVGDRSVTIVADRKKSHIGDNYYSLDFDNSYFDGKSIEWNTSEMIPVLAAADGYVTEADEDEYDATKVPPERNGHYVVIRHGIPGHESYFETTYLHLVNPTTFTNGQPIPRGTLLGFMGNSGMVPQNEITSRLVHLHFGVRFFMNGMEKASGNVDIQQLKRVRLEDRGLPEYFIGKPDREGEPNGFYWSSNQGR